MPVDTAIYGDLLKQPSPIENAQAFAGINNSLQQNALLQNQTAVANQEYRFKRAMGPIMQQSVDPQTGQVDWDKAITLGSQNPDAAWGMGDLMTKVYQGKGLQLDNKLKQMNIVSKEQEFFGNAAASLGAKGNSVKKSDVASRISSLYSDMAAAGMADQSMQDRLISFMAQLPADGEPLAQHLQQIGMQAAGATDSLNRVTGQFSVQDIGGKKILGYTNPAKKQWVPIGSLDMTPTTGELNAPVTTTDASGAQHVGTAAQTLPLVTGGGAQVNGSAAAPGAPQQAPAVSPGVAPNANPQTKLSPFAQGQQENMVDYAKNIQKDTSGIQTQLQMIQQLQDLSKEFHSGAGAYIRTKVGGLMQALGMPQSAYDQVANGSLSASQAFAKYSVQNTMNVLRQAIGGQGRLTNLEFEQFLHSNPNPDTDPRAIDKILEMAQRIYQIKIAEQKGLTDWIKTGHDPVAFPEAWTQKLISRGILRDAKPGDLSQKGVLPGG